MASGAGYTGLMKKSTTTGFSIIELLVTIAVGSIMLTVAAPSFTNLYKSSSITSQTNSLSTALQYAHDQATKLPVGSTAVDVIPNAANDWSQGWVVQIRGGVTLRTYPAAPRNVTMVGDVTGNGTIAFNAPFGYPDPTGNANGTATITICDNDRVGETGRQLNVNRTGRISLNLSFTCS